MTNPNIVYDRNRLKSLNPLQMTSLAQQISIICPNLPEWYRVDPRGHKTTKFDDAVLDRYKSMTSPFESSVVGSKNWTIRWPSALFSDRAFMALSPWMMVETHNAREFSTFMLYLQGRYICDTMQPSLHHLTKQWAIGGRGGLPTGLYKVWPYNWKSKGGLPVWELVGDRRRGAILLHAGNTVKDSQGCILCGSLSRSGSLVNSRIATATVWSLLNQSTRYGVTAKHPGFTILRLNKEYYE